MPVVMKVGGLKFVIYPHDHKPAHVHVYKSGASAKFIIETGECIRCVGFSLRAVKLLSKFVIENKVEFLESWKEYEGQN